MIDKDSFLVNLNDFFLDLLIDSSEEVNKHKKREINTIRQCLFDAVEFCGDITKENYDCFKTNNVLPKQTYSIPISFTPSVGIGRGIRVKSKELECSLSDVLRLCILKLGFETTILKEKYDSALFYNGGDRRYSDPMLQEMKNAVDLLCKKQLNYTEALEALCIHKGFGDDLILIKTIYGEKK